MSAVFSTELSDSTLNSTLDSQVAQLRVPPHSIEAESSVLGGLLLDNQAWDRVNDLLVENDFYRHEHKLIFTAVGALINASKPADVITVFEHLQNQGLAEGTGGLTYLNSLAQYEVHVAKYYYSRGAYVAAIARAQAAIKDYQNVPAVREAMVILVKSYDALGMTQLRDDAQRVLESSYGANTEQSVEKQKESWWKLW